jgi:NDP-sugar pyrophosphorylase family protein
LSHIAGQSDHSASQKNGIRAVILAGGKGTRLYPYTAILPKPLVPLGDIPILEVVIRQLIQHGITDITFTLGHLAELIKAYFTQHKTLAEQVRFSFVEEESPTGTAGSLASVPDLSSTFLVMNGDLLTDIDYRALVAYHEEQQAQLTIATYRRQEKIDLGVLQTNGDNQVTGYIEKPVYDYQVSMGVYVYEPTVLKYIEPGSYLDFPTLVMKLLEKGANVCAFPWEGHWLDIGRPDDYAEAQALFAKQPQIFGFDPRAASLEDEGQS